jgi:hypothetical protein
VLMSIRVVSCQESNDSSSCCSKYSCVACRQNENDASENRDAARYENQDTGAQKAALPHQFDLITASSVLAFVNDKVATLKCLGNMLRGKDSHIVHWDWLAGTFGEPPGGVTVEGVRQLHAESGLETVFSDVCFKFMGMDVVLGVARRPL